MTVPPVLSLTLLAVLLVVSLVAWAVPRQLYVTTPLAWRRSLYSPRSSWWPAVALAVIPVALAFPIGYGMGDPSLSRIEMGFTLSGILGGMTGAGLLWSWRRARREQLHAEASPGPALPPVHLGTPPWLLELPTAPTEALVPVSAPDFVIERGLRRARTVLFFVATMLAIVIRLQPARTGQPDDGPLLVTFSLVLLAALAVTPVLRWRTHDRSKASPQLLGGVVTTNDTDRLIRRFPHAPLFRATGPHDRLLQPTVVDGSTGGRYWWVVVQLAAMHGARQPLQRTTCLVWLPGVRLPPVLVRGRDNTELVNWFTPGLVLESWDFGQRLHALADGGHRREATDILHARMMDHLLAYLPDGGSLVVRDDLLSLVFDRQLHLSEVASVITFLLGCADLLPTFVLKDADTRRLPR